METTHKLEEQALPSKLTEILGTTLLSHDGEISTESALKDIDIIGIYFSAQWCGQCMTFTPDLMEKYSKLREADKKFEIIFCTFDENPAQFEEYYKSMPWLAFPPVFGKPKGESEIQKKKILNNYKIQLYQIAK